jgi:hypothetical protein
MVAAMTLLLVLLLSICLSPDRALAASPAPIVSPSAHCSDTVIGQIPCTWTNGVNLYPGDGDSFSHKNTDNVARGLVTQDGFDSVTINVPISAANFTDAHVQMPSAGSYETYTCSRSGKSPKSQTYYSPTAAQIRSIGRTVLKANPRSTVVVRPMLALGGSCDPSEYYPTGRYGGTGYPHRSNVGAFGHFYTNILLQLAKDAAAIGHHGHVVLDDATELDCLFDDPHNAGYRAYFGRLTGTIGARYRWLPQMFSLTWDFAASSDAACGYPKFINKARVYDEASRDAGFLRDVGLVGVDENFPLNANRGHDINSVAELLQRWQTATLTVAGHKQTAAELVQLLHEDTGRDVVLSAIGYVDCSLNPGYQPWSIPSNCNRRLSKTKQAQPSRAQVTSEQHAVSAAYCYWTQSEGSSDPWFRGLWWWDRDFDSQPYTNPYDLTWGQNKFGISALSTVKSWQNGHGSCPTTT